MIIGYCLLMAVSFDAKSQSTKIREQKPSSMETGKQSKQVVQQFFEAFGKGDVQGVILSFHDSCSITAVRQSERTNADLYGVYHGKEGLKEFLSKLGSNFDTREFSVSHVAAEGNIAFASGRFTHVVKRTGKSFSSDWALMCVVQDGQIREYHFYEDSEKFAEAARK